MNQFVYMLKVTRLAMLAGFGTALVFYWLGAAPASDGLLSQAAHLPGDPFERAFPWLPALLLLASPVNRVR